MKMWEFGFDTHKLWDKIGVKKVLITVTTLSINLTNPLLPPLRHFQFHIHLLYFILPHLHPQACYQPIKCHITKLCQSMIGRNLLLISMDILILLLHLVVLVWSSD